MPDKEKYLGELEQLILLAILRTDNKSYGIEISDIILEHGKRDVSLGSLYITLNRMEKKGLVSSCVGEATAQRGGRAKKYFSVTAEGQYSIQKSISLFKNMTQGLSFFDVLGEGLNS